MDKDLTVIKAQNNFQLLEISELWKYRELFIIFVWRDITVRYKQTFFGVAWVIFQPLLTTGIFTIFFGNLAKIPSNHMPYQLFVFTGLVFWTFFSTSLSQASNSLVDNANIIKKVYFPLEILPISSIITSIVDFSINFIVLIIISLLFGFVPSISIILFAPICLLIAVFTSSGLGLFLSSVNIKYRDVRYILPFFIQILLFLTPVIYPSSIIRDSFRMFFAFNPMTGVIETIRELIKNSGQIDVNILLISGVSSLAIFCFGLYYFKKTQKFFADQI